MEQYNLFVYGSLRPNFFNFEKYLEGKTLDIKPAVLKNMDLYHMPYKGYPAITKGTGVVVGEIITVKDYDSTVKAIDIMEGFLGENNPNNEYHKILLEVNHLNSNKKEKCYTYFYNADIDKDCNEKAVFISDGDWKNYMLNINKDSAK